MVGLFAEHEWRQILQIVKDSGASPGLASPDKSYMTSPDTAVICDNTKSPIINVAKTTSGDWVLKG
jgi:hypothetical protein